ncbi:DNA-binding SARP family transcriptional activator [Catenulispora sp. GAS73]|uniref:tetratricopeptide repeat protein n=1 Tax=Catenulispora sp. GAS73 TaxID=3156269 RepID=UPI003516B177
MDIRLLGRIRILIPGEVVEVGPPQRCLVLAALAIDAGMPVSTEELKRRVWNDHEQPERAQRSLHAHISSLRALLKQHIDSRPVQILSRARGYVLDFDASHVDLSRVEGLISQARAESEPGSVLRLLREARQLAQGTPLAGLESRWADGVRLRWQNRYRDILTAWARAEIDAGDPDVTVEPLRGLADDNLHDQRLVAALMRALYFTGRPKDALDLHRRAYQQIVKEDGLEIGTELTQVQLGILRGDLAVPGRAQGARVGGGPASGRTPSGPLRIGKLPPRADNFQDRATSEVLHAAAGPGQTTVLTQVVAGLGGVGKTQLAAEFARQLLAAGALDLMLWVPATSRDSVVSDYVLAGSALALGPNDEAPERTAARLLSFLANTDLRWMVVLDDLAGPADIRDLWPPTRPNGRTVVTTRRRDADLLAGRNLVEVSVFSEAEAVAYMRRKLEHVPYLADDVLGVVADLGALPLALSHAAAYMIDLDLPCSDYRARFADRKRRLTDLFPSQGALYDGNSHTVATTWFISIQAADRLPPVGLAQPLLEMVSSLNPNGIPEGVFAAPTSQDYLAERLGRRPDPAEIRDGLRGLHRFHLITHTEGMIRVHALVQRAVREVLGPEKSTDVARASAHAILEIWPAADVEEGQLLRANAMALQDNWPAAIWDPARGIHPVMMRTIDSLGHTVQLSEAIRLCRRLTSQAVDFFGREHPDTLALRNQLAVWLGDAGEAQEAITSLASLASDTAAALGRDHPMSISVRRNLGYQWGQAGFPAKAVAELGIVLEDQRRVLDPEDRAIAGTRAQLVFWRSKTGDTSTAIGELEDLVAQAVRQLGADHPETFELRGQLALFRPDIALSAREMQQVLDDMRLALGAGHRDVSVLRLNTAMRQREAGDLTTAAAALQGLLTDRIKSHGPYHRDTAATRHGLSRVLTDLGDFAGAAAELEEVIEGMRRLFGPMHTDTLNRRYELALVLELASRPEQAAELLRSVLADQLTALGDETHESVVATREALARLRVGER